MPPCVQTISSSSSRSTAPLQVLFPVLGKTGACYRQPRKKYPASPKTKARSLTFTAPKGEVTALVKLPLPELFIDRTNASVRLTRRQPKPCVLTKSRELKRSQSGPSLHMPPTSICAKKLETRVKDDSAAVLTAPNKTDFFFMPQPKKSAVLKVSR